MPVSHLASLRHRVIVVVLAGALAVGLAAVGVVLTVPAASSAPRTVASAPQPADVAAAVSAAARLRPWRRYAGRGPSSSSVTRSRPGSTTSSTTPRRPGGASSPRELGVRARVRAEGGAGFVNPGLVGCAGHTFAEQLSAPLVAEAVAGAGAVVIEGGRTDTQTCRKGGGYDLIPQEQLRASVESFMAEVAAAPRPPTPARWWSCPGDPRAWRRTGTGSPRSSATRRPATASPSSTRPAC